MLICIVKFIYNKGEIFTGITCIEWSCDVRRAYVWGVVPLPILRRDCEGQGICLPTHIWCGQNECITQRGWIWGHMTWKYEELDDVVWITPKLVLVGCNIQEPYATYQCYEEVPMGGNPTVCNLFSWESGSFKGGWVV